MKHLSMLLSILCLAAGADAQFQKTFGTSNSHELAYDAIPTADGGFAVAGYTEKMGKKDDVLLLKLDDQGNLEWSRTFGGNGYEEGKTIVQTPDVVSP